MYTCAVYFNETTSDGFSLSINGEITFFKYKEFSVILEKLLSTNEEHFPEIMDFLIINKLNDSKLRDVHESLGFSFINSHCFDSDNSQTKNRLINNLTYLKRHDVNLNLEMFNFLRSLAFGGKVLKRGKKYLEIINTLLPFCTDFFFDYDNYWKKIRYFCSDTKEVKTSLNFLVKNFGTEKNYKFLPMRQNKPFSLKHISRNKIRESVWRKSKIDLLYLTYCHENLPKVLFGYIKFETLIQ